MSSEGTLKPVKEGKVWRWGIMGSGGICQDFSHALRDIVPDAVLQAVGARTLESAQKLQQQFGVKKAYGSFEEVAADPEVDICYVGSIHNRHREHALLAIKHGKAVLVEKAFTQNAKEAAEVLQAAAQQGVFVMEAYWTRFMPWCRRLREIVQSGQIGRVAHVSCDFAIQFDPNQAKRLFDPALCGGALLDVGVYPVSIASMIFGGGPPQQIVAVGDLMDTGVDGHIATTLRYGKNATAQLYCGALIDGPSVLTVMGTKGRVVVHDETTGYWHCASALTLSLKGQDGKYEKEEISFPQLKYKGKFNYKGSEQLAYEAQEVQRCLAEGLRESPLMPHAETLTVMRTMDEIRRQVGVVYPEERS